MSEAQLSEDIKRLERLCLPSQGTPKQNVEDSGMYGAGREVKTLKGPWPNGVKSIWRYEHDMIVYYDDRLSVLSAKIGGVGGAQNYLCILRKLWLIQRESEQPEAGSDDEDTYLPLYILGGEPRVSGNKSCFSGWVACNSSGSRCHVMEALFADVALRHIPGDWNVHMISKGKITGSVTLTEFYASKGGR